MAGLRYAAIRGMFELLADSGVTGLVRQFSRARGVILTLHRVVPERPAAFAPNAILQVTPEFLDHAIGRVRKLGYDIVDLDEALRRLGDPKAKRFAVFTFDDAYRDNLIHALPVLRRHGAPFTLYVPTALVDGVGEVWWQALEDILARQRAIALAGAGGVTEYLTTETAGQKRAAYDRLYATMRRMPEPERVTFIRDLASQYGLDLEAHCRALIMDWRELKTFAQDKLCTIGAHTVHHYELSKLPADQAMREIEQSVRVLQAQLGKTPAHLSYPIGSRVAAGGREYRMAAELGFRTAVTTIPGGLYRETATSLLALPRVSLNGLFQARRYVDVFATPAVFEMLPG